MLSDKGRITASLSVREWDVLYSVLGQIERYEDPDINEIMKGIQDKIGNHLEVYYDENLELIEDIKL